jgi:hypothetical protein
MRVRFDEVARWLIMERGSLHMLFNFSAKPVRLAVPEHSVILLSSEKDVLVVAEEIDMPAQTFVAVAANADRAQT